MDLRRRLLLGLIELSRLDVDFLSPFMDEVPMSAAEDPSDPWWESEDCEVLLDAIVAAADMLRQGP